MKKLSLVLLLIPCYLNALTPLPNNAFLQYKDNQKEVKILQEILNSDPDTRVAEEGQGSPGNEGWFFGIKTQEALVKFQEKHGLKITGKINIETFKKLNQIANGNKTTGTGTKLNISTKEIQILKKELQESIAKQQTETKIKETPQEERPPVKSQTLLESIINKYTGYFTSGNTSTQQPVLQQQAASDNPYLYGSNNSNSGNPYLSNSSGSGGGGGGGASPFGNNSNPNSFFGGQLGQNNIFGSNLNDLPLGPVGPGAINNIGKIDGILPSGSGGCGGSGPSSNRLLCIGNATKYAHGAMSDGCVADKGDQQNNQRSASGQYLSRVGVKAIPAVALPPVVHKKVGWGTAVEVKDMSTGKCKAFPILDSGPANFVLDRGTVIDLTGSAFDILQGKQPCANVANKITSFPGSMKVTYAVNVNGKKLAPGEVGECTMLVN